jgi:hypothetical protein
MYKNTKKRKGKKNSCLKKKKINKKEKEIEEQNLYRITIV